MPTRQPEPEKVRVLNELTVLEINIGSGPNAWGYTVEVVDKMTDPPLEGEAP